MYSMEDVLAKVWDEVYKKWVKALKDGWSDDLWDGG